MDCVNSWSHSANIRPAMVFDYYFRLSRRQQQIYRQSDRVESIHLPRPELLRSPTNGLTTSLRQANRRTTQDHCDRIVNHINRQLSAPSARVTVLARRPSHHWGELHGLYEPAQQSQRAHITVWMRTAKRRQVVAFRTFLRTLLHELCHHLDYEYYKFHDSLHTEGFYRRESSLFVALTEDRSHPEQQSLQL